MSLFDENEWYRVVVAADRGGERRARHAVVYVEAPAEGEAREAGLATAREDWAGHSHSPVPAEGPPLQGHRVVSCTRLTDDDRYAFVHHRLDFETADRRRLVRGYDLMEDGDAWWVVHGELRRRLAAAEAEIRRLRGEPGAHVIDEAQAEEMGEADILEEVYVQPGGGLSGRGGAR